MLAIFPTQLDTSDAWDVHYHGSQASNAQQSHNGSPWRKHPLVFPHHITDMFHSWLTRITNRTAYINNIWRKYQQHMEEAYRSI